MIGKDNDWAKQQKTKSHVEGIFALIIAL